MSTYGLGAMYNGTEDKIQEFINRRAAYLGWSETEAPFFHVLLRRINVGDFVFLKSYPPNRGLLIKAIGIVTEPQFIAGADELGARIGVDWRCVPDEPLVVGPVNDKADFMRRGSIYEELNPRLLRQITTLLFA